MMKPLPAPHVPGKTEFERFDNAVRQVFTVSKTDLLRMEAEEKGNFKTAPVKHAKAARAKRKTIRKSS